MEDDLISEPLAEGLFIHDWAQYSVSIPFRPEAKALFYGFLVSGTGKAWADDLELMVDGKPVWEAPRVIRPNTILDQDHEFDAGSGVSVPDIEVKPTIAGLRAGKDEVLEEALRWILVQR